MEKHSRAETCPERGVALLDGDLLHRVQLRSTAVKTVINNVNSIKFLFDLIPRRPCLVTPAAGEQHASNPYRKELRHSRHCGESGCLGEQALHDAGQLVHAERESLNPIQSQPINRHNSKLAI